LGCMRAEKENATADECKYKDTKKIVEGVQMRI